MTSGAVRMPHLQSLPMELDLSAVPPELHEQAHEAFADRDALGFVIICGSNTRALALVADNVSPLLAAGIYEPALLQALTGTRVNHARWSLGTLRFLVDLSDPDRLRAAGDPLPGPGPFRLYRGVAGTGRARKVRGLHWTATPSTAAWFATRFPGMADPAVYVVDVPASAVRAYIADRHEDDYIVALPARIRPQRLAELPEAKLPRDEAYDTLVRPGAQ